MLLNFQNYKCEQWQIQYSSIWLQALNTGTKTKNAVMCACIGMCTCTHAYMYAQSQWLLSMHVRLKGNKFRLYVKEFDWYVRLCVCANACASTCMDVYKDIAVHTYSHMQMGQCTHTHACTHALACVCLDGIYKCLSACFLRQLC